MLPSPPKGSPPGPRAAVGPLEFLREHSAPSWSCKLFLPGAECLFMFPAASADCESCTIGTRGTGGLLHCQDEMLLTVMSRRNTGRPGLCATPGAWRCGGGGEGGTSALPGLCEHLQRLPRAPSERRTGRPWGHLSPPLHLPGGGEEGSGRQTHAQMSARPHRMPAPQGLASWPAVHGPAPQTPPRPSALWRT